MSDRSRSDRSRSELSLSQMSRLYVQAVKCDSVPLVLRLKWCWLDRLWFVVAVVNHCLANFFGVSVCSNVLAVYD